MQYDATGDAFVLLLNHDTRSPDHLAPRLCSPRSGRDRSTAHP
jgi:hypothetical protein